MNYSKDNLKAVSTGPASDDSIMHGRWAKKTGMDYSGLKQNLKETGYELNLQATGNLRKDAEYLKRADVHKERLARVRATASKFESGKAGEGEV